MKTAVEWLIDKILNDKGVRVISTSTFYIKDEIVKQAKEMEVEQKDDYAVEFAEWYVRRATGLSYFKIPDKEFEQFKNK